MSDSYRRIRNTARFLLGNLAGFDPARDAVAPVDMVELDRWIVLRAAALQRDIVEAYRRYEFHLIYQLVHNFCVVDLGGFYLDVLKDRMYTLPKRALARRSAQTAIWHVAEAMVRWLAPVLSFTAEEIWKHLPGQRAASVLHSTWHELPQVPELLRDWDLLLQLRGDVARELEKLRAASTIGAPLEAEIDLWCEAVTGEKLAAFGDELRFLLITSEARVHIGAPAAAAAAAVPGATLGEAVRIEVRRSQATKCVRCWHYRADVGSHADHPELCGRCIENIADFDGDGGETRLIA
jgi:isoleucyl-tRNA synthetase